MPSSISEITVSITATLTTKPAIAGAADKVAQAPLKIRAAKKKKR